MKRTPNVKTFGRIAALAASWTIAVTFGCHEGVVRERLATTRQALLATYEPDCNDPDVHDLACTEPARDLIADAQASGYPYYIGHAEPTAEFFSRAGASGSNMQWKFQLPATDPTPEQDGSSVANFELYSALWLGLALCDPNSFPYGACAAASDNNNPSTAGAAFLELQFYPPGSPFGGCSDSQWCVRLHINTFENNNTLQKTNCIEPTTQQYVTTDGTPGGSPLLMSTGDTLLVTIHDTANGLETDVNDATSTGTGSMVASGANGFVHNSDLTTCNTTAFDFHAMYATASPGQTVPWAGLRPNVAFNFEIGHFELCSDSSCSTPGDSNDSDDGSCQTKRGVGGCFGKDDDQDGLQYQADWADGTAAHPASVVIGSPDDRGVGPLSSATSGGSTYDEGYTKIKFATTESTATAFYPFFSQAGTGTSCRFNFGNDISGVTTNDFSKASQYATTIDNPCFPGVRETKIAYIGDTAQDFGDVATLSAVLSDTDHAGVAGKTISFMLGTQSCSATTAVSGLATCTISLTQPPGLYTVTATFAGDRSDRAANTSAAFTINQEESAVAYTGAMTSDFHDAFTASATLTEDGVTPLAGRTVTFSLNGAESCSATTDAGGNASCSITPSEPSGTYNVTASFAGDSLYVPSSTTAAFEVKLEEDTLTSTGSLQVFAQNGTATMSASLAEDGLTPVAGRTVTVALGSGAGAQSCTGVTDATGVATCTIAPVTVGLGPQPITDTFASDGFYQSVTHPQQAMVFAFLDNGAFTLGDETAADALASGAPVTWWGSRWAADNLLSNGPAPAAFKGFVQAPATEPPVCANSWTTDPGNSSSPPAATAIPAYMGVLAIDRATQSGSTLGGDAPSIVVVKTQPGYEPNPGHPGMGTVVARFCP
jgi:hypothetical protein